MTKKIVRREIALDKLSFSESVPPLMQRLYGGRGVFSDEEIRRDFGALIPPDKLLGLPEAITVLRNALNKQQRVLIVGDFDADGATSSALAVQALRSFGFKYVDYLVPNRFEFGYGLTPEIVEVALERKPDVIVTVDNGISSVAGVKAAKAAGIRVVITDHHLPGAELPAADAIVNPNQHGCSFESKALAGVGVIFYLMSALRSALRDKSWFELNGVPDPNMASFLDLVALGTVADVVPLDANNRILVHQGLLRIRKGVMRPGLQALLKVAGKSAADLGSTDLGFSLGPRLNAAGRLDDMSLGIECLLAEDAYTAQELAQQLDELNRDRRAIEGHMKEQALTELNKLEELWQEQGVPSGLCLFNEDWHQGVIGILASRVKDRYHRPVVVFAPSDNGEIKGSARSISGFHIRDALDTVASRNDGLLTKFGGHAMAAGMSLQADKFALFEAAFEAVAKESLSADDLEQKIISDGELRSDDLTLEVAELIHSSGPWGQNFPEPVFDGEFEIISQRLVGEKHLKLRVKPMASEHSSYDAIAFNVDLAIWPKTDVSTVRLAYRLGINDFRNHRQVQLMVEDLFPM